MLDIFSFFVYNLLAMKNKLIKLKEKFSLTNDEVERLNCEIDNLFVELSLANNEDNVQQAWDVFNSHVDRIFKSNGKVKFKKTLDIDRYSNTALSEFKFDKKFIDDDVRAKVLSQALYYVHRISKGSGEYKTLELPAFCFCMSDKWGFICEVKQYRKIYTNNKIDWSGTPCCPTSVICSQVKNTEDFCTKHIYDFSNKEDLYHFVESYISIMLDNKKVYKEVTPENLLHLYEANWCPKRYNAIKCVLKNKGFNGHLIDDIITACFFAETTRSEACIFTDTGVTYKTPYCIVDVNGITISSRDKIFENYDIISLMEISENTREFADRLISIETRRFHGDYYTPRPFAQLGWKYIMDKTGLKNIDWKSGKFRLMDYATGSGNLEIDLPKEAIPYCRLIAWRKEEAEGLKKTFPEAMVVHYDTLNDDIRNTPDENGNIFDYKKLPQELVDEIEQCKNGEITFIIFINPPYGNESEKYNSAADTTNTIVVDKSGMTDTKIKKHCPYTQLYVQFLARIRREFAGAKGKVYLGLYSPPQFINGENFLNFRNDEWRGEYLGGFQFSSKCFHGTSGKGWTVLFSVWDLSNEIPLTNQIILADDVNKKAEVIDSGYQFFVLNNPDETMNKYVKRKRNTVLMPCYGSAYNFTKSTRAAAKKVSEGMLAWIRPENYFSDVDKNCIMSGPSAANAGCALGEWNWEEGLVTIAVKGLVNVSAKNNSNLFYTPTKKLSDEFVKDCIIYLLCNISFNQCIPHKNVQLNDGFVDLPNEFFPFSIEYVQNKACRIDAIKTDAMNATKERYLYTYLKNATLSYEAQKLFTALEELYDLFFSYATFCDASKFELNCWDLGVKQVVDSLRDIKSNTLSIDEKNEIRAALDKLDDNLSAMKMKLLPQLNEYGIVRY